MKIVGIATIELLHADGTREFHSEVENHISYPVWRAFFYSPSGYAAEMRLPVARNPAAQNYDSGYRWYIYYGARDVHPTTLNSFYAADGRVSVDVNTPYWTDRADVTDPDTMTFTAVIPAPLGQPRTIRVLGIEADAAGPADHMAYAKYTILRLTTPCVQAVTVSVIITYRLYIHPAIPTTSPGVSDTWWDRMRAVLKIAATPSSALNVSYANTNGSFISSCYDYSELPTHAVGTYQYSDDTMVSGYELTDNGLYNYAPTINNYTNVLRSQFTYDVTHVPATGTWVKTIALAGRGVYTPYTQGLNTGAIYQLAVPATTSPVQNVYPQRNNPLGPFQDLTVNNTATMSGVLNLDPSTWVNPKLQRLVRITIDVPGAVGVATYGISVSPFLAGFVGNRWVPRTALMPQSQVANREFRLNPNPAYYETLILQGGTTYRSPDGSQYVAAANCQRNVDGVVVYNIVTGAKLVFNAATGLAATAVSDLDVVGGYVYVTCANTGIWRISPDMLTVVAVPSPTGVNAAYQISAMANGTLWVLCDGGLCHLTNPTAAVGSLVWTVHKPTGGDAPSFTYAGITDGNWSHVTAMSVDPDHADNRMLLVTSALPGGDTSGTYRKGFVWWDTASGVAAAPATSGFTYNATPWTDAGLLTVSDSIRCHGGRWVYNLGTTASPTAVTCHCAYGAAALNGVYFNGIQHQRYIPATINGVAVWIGSQVGTYRQPGYVIKASTIATIPNANALSTVSPYVDCMLRQGANSYTSSMQTTETGVGNIASTLVYLPGHNLLFTQEDNPMMYGVTPFMLQPDLPSPAIYALYRNAWWRDYGWDGADWVLNHPGRRPTHSAVSPTTPLDGLGVSFTDGVSGTSFVTGEFWSTTVGQGLMKDNGTVYNVSSFAWSLDATAPFTQTSAIPQTPLGLRIDEVLTYRPIDANYTSNTGVRQAGARCVQHKGTVVSRPVDHMFSSGCIIADQLIPGSTEFDLRFKWITFTADSGGYSPSFGLYTGASSHSPSLHFRYTDSGNLEVLNNATVLATIPTPSVDAECRIVRNASNVMQAYYDGVAVGATVSSNASMSVIGYGTYLNNHSGWYDTTLTYTEARRVLILGDDVALTGSYDPSFTGLTVTGLVQDTKVLIGTGTPLAAVLQYTPSSVALTATGTAKVLPGAGWIVFHDAEPADTVTVSTVMHYLYNAP
jgi:hypothetical protein